MHRNLVYLLPFGHKVVTFFPGNQNYINEVLSPGVLHQAEGSILLKMLMHARVAEAYKPDDWTQICTNSIDINNSYVVIHKKIFDNIVLLELLKRKNNFLIFDVVDGKINNFSYVDAILCCSHGSYNHYRQVQQKIPVLFSEHCMDLRLNPQKTNIDHFSGYYFGALENFLIYNGIFEFIKPCFSSLPHQPVTDWMESLPLANFHYAVRTQKECNIFKPFTKGVIASLYCANIIIHQDDGDALHYLGSDYPYLLKGKINENKVVHLLQKAKDDFGGKDWLYGISIMESVKKQYTHKRVAQNFWKEILKL